MDSVDVSDGAGFAGIGTSSFIRAAFDNIRISDGKCMILVLQIIEQYVMFQQCDHSQTTWDDKQ